MFYKWLTILLVISLLAEHSFWFSGRDIVDQLPHAVKSFKSQEHINIAIVMAEVKKAFDNASNPKKDPAWLIQWVINNKLVCNLCYILFTILKSWTRITNSFFFFFQSVRNQFILFLFLFFNLWLFFQAMNATRYSVSVLTKCILKNNKATCIIVSHDTLHDTLNSRLHEI